MHAQQPAPAGANLSALAGANLPFCYLPIRAVCAAVGFSTSRIYALVKVGEFPAGDLIGAQSRRWKSTDIAAWLIAQAEKSALREAEMSAPLRRKTKNAALVSARARAERAALAAGSAS